MVALLEMAFRTPVPPPVARAQRNWGGFSAEYVKLTSDAPYEFRNRGERHYLALHDITLREGELRIEGLKRLTTRNLRDTITFVPKGCGTEGWCHPEPRGNSFVAMYFDPEAIRQELAERYDSVQPPPFAYAQNASLRGTLEKLKALVQEPEIDDLHAESLCLLASLEIFRVVTDGPGRLSDRQVALVRDFVEAHLADQIGLSDLASVAGLSRFHFSRAFKATIGENPHAFVQKRRISRAANLLRTGDLPIEMIASAVGYRGTPQFRRAFREVTGVAPLNYRLQGR